MERTVLRYAPSYWDTSYEYDRQFELNQSSEEFNRIRHQVRQAMGNNNLSVNQILRVQNIHDYGQFLIKQQLMAVDKSYKNYYRVNKFI